LISFLAFGKILCKSSEPDYMIFLIFFQSSEITKQYGLGRKTSTKVLYYSYRNRPVKTKKKKGIAVIICHH